jgi:DNA-damage-inducible protein J
MEKTTLVKAKVPSRRLKSAEAILARLGLQTSDAINMMLVQVIRQKALPFSVRRTDERLLAAEEALGRAWEDAFGAY